MKSSRLLILCSLFLVSCEQPYVPPTPGGGGQGIKSPETVGQPLKAWTKGALDIHFINTSTGECTFIIFPDGTQMLVDAAGAHNATGDVGSTTNVGIRSRWDPMKESGFRAGKFIADYIKTCMEWTGNNTLDYVLNTHFHGDHFGGTTGMPVSDKSSSYVKQSLPEVLDLLPARLLMDRGWPGYDYPFDMQTKPSNASIVKNYVTAVKWHVNNTGLKAERFKAGAADQIVLQRDAEAYPSLKVQNIAVNGDIWDGPGTTTATATFPALKDIVVENPKSIGNADK
ncbi:MAG: MBL fold metallo-hydrolase, partial [Bacteroidales bacterium]|nr:MBL fold metallo-hydrolase [Bacteroidales bacterium]